MREGLWLACLIAKDRQSLLKAMEEGTEMGPEPGQPGSGSAPAPALHRLGPGASPCGAPRPSAGHLWPALRVDQQGPRVGFLKN